MLPTWNETEIALANHLWQSTLFAILVGALTLLFRRNGAAVRYRLWLIASMKFLVPFSLFAALGSLLQWHPVHPPAPSEVPALVQHISQPFTPVPMVIPGPSIAKAATGSNASIVRASCRSLERPSEVEATPPAPRATRRLCVRAGCVSTVSGDNRTHQPCLVVHFAC